MTKSTYSDRFRWIALLVAAIVGFSCGRAGVATITRSPTTTAEIAPTTVSMLLAPATRDLEVTYLWVEHDKRGTIVWRQNGGQVRWDFALGIDRNTKFPSGGFILNQTRIPTRSSMVAERHCGWYVTHPASGVDVTCDQSSSLGLARFLSLGVDAEVVRSAAPTSPSVTNSSCYDVRITGDVTGRACVDTDTGALTALESDEYGDRLEALSIASVSEPIAPSGLLSSAVSNPQDFTATVPVDQLRLPEAIQTVLNLGG